MEKTTSVIPIKTGMSNPILLTVYETIISPRLKVKMQAPSSAPTGIKEADGEVRF
jgi:hypothetical protein